MLTTALAMDSAVFQTLQWRLWLFQLLIWALLLPAYTSWSLAIFALLLLAKVWQLYRQTPVWTLTRNNLLAAGILAVLLVNLPQLGVMHLMFHLLLLAAVLRLLGLDSRRRKDLEQLLWVHYFLLACAFILHQDLWLAALVMLAFALNISAHHLAFCRHMPVLQWQPLLRNGLAILGMSAVLFVVFPRLPPLWQLPGAKAAETGLSDNIAPGDIGALLQSNKLAFRVQFHDRAPPADSRYFRAKIYDWFDGEGWRAQRPQPRARLDDAVSANIRYTVVAEPHQQFSLFALGLVRQHSTNVMANRELLIVAGQPVSQRLSYQLTSALSPIPAQTESRSYLQLPNSDPRARQLAKQLASSATDAKDLTRRISQYFHQQQFSYRLDPDQITAPMIDNFLFERKTGFCSHYASAAVYMLRAAGVPARLVGGYLGGDWQDDGAYLQVLQRDAHAWVEYLQDGYWHTYDPTAQIEPSLLTEAAASSSLNDLGGFGGNWISLRLELWLLQPLRNMDYYWSLWVLGFDGDDQQSLFGQLQAWQQNLRWRIELASWLLLPLCFGLWWWWRQRPAVAPQIQLFAPLLRLRHKPLSQSYQQYLLCWQQVRPDAAALLELLLQAYLRWQFGEEPMAYAQARRVIKQLVPLLKQPGS